VVIGVLFDLQFSIWTSQIPFNLREVFGHKSCLVVNHQSILIFFVAEDPFGANVVLVLGGRLNDPYIIADEVVQLFVHCQQPIRILESFLYTLVLNKGDKRVMFNK
jgi:hypothetical protein